MDFSCLEGDFVPSLPRQGVVEVERAAFHPDVDAQAKPERRIEQITVVTVLFVGPSVKEKMHIVESSEPVA